MEGYVANPALYEAVEGIRKALADTKLDEYFFSAWLHLLKSSKVFKTEFCELIVERIEEEIQWLDEQI